VLFVSLTVISVNADSARPYRPASARFPSGKGKATRRHGWGCFHEARTDGRKDGAVTRQLFVRTYRSRKNRCGLPQGFARRRCPPQEPTAVIRKAV